ncbi:MAG: hypothetical protein GAK34_03487 [Delftia tsuruhatensis]|nr:MAG: hypothetical protein GAK34_03487 [Delftia tsuruhatensis]
MAFSLGYSNSFSCARGYAARTGYWQIRRPPFKVRCRAPAPCAQALLTRSVHWAEKIVGAPHTGSHATSAETCASVDCRHRAGPGPGRGDRATPDTGAGPPGTRAGRDRLPAQQGDRAAALRAAGDHGAGAHPVQRRGAIRAAAPGAGYAGAHAVRRGRLLLCLRRTRQRAAGCAADGPVGRGPVRSQQPGRRRARQDHPGCRAQRRRPGALPVAKAVLAAYRGQARLRGHGPRMGLVAGHGPVPGRCGAGAAPDRRKRPGQYRGHALAHLRHCGAVHRAHRRGGAGVQSQRPPRVQHQAAAPGPARGAFAGGRTHARGARPA